MTQMIRFHLGTMLVLSLCIAYPVFTHAQASAFGGLTGYPFSSDKQELPGSSDLLEGTASDAAAYFSITNIPTGKYALLISSLGYVTYMDTVTFRAGEILKLNIELEEASTQLEAVTVFGKSTLQETKELAYEAQVIDARKLHNTTLDRVSGAWVRETSGVGSRMNFSLNGFTGDRVPDAATITKVTQENMVMNDDMALAGITTQAGSCVYQTDGNALFYQATEKNNTDLFT